RRYLELGCDEIDVADTIGVGTPARVDRGMKAVTEVGDPARIAGHFLDTYGQALANILASLQAGISIYHASVAGLGGCPYAKGATGNVATEDALYMLHGMGIETGVDLAAVVDIGQWTPGQLDRQAAGRARHAVAARRSACPGGPTSMRAADGPDAEEHRKLLAEIGPWPIEGPAWPRWVVVVAWVVLGVVVLRLVSTATSPAGELAGTAVKASIVLCVVGLAVL